MQTIDAGVEARPQPLTAEQQALFDATVPYVRKVAKRRATPFVPYEDQLQHGLMGLLDAARRWDETKANGAKFRTYAAKRIYGAMTDAERLGFGRTIHVPRSAWDALPPEERAASQPRRYIAANDRSGREYLKPIEEFDPEDCHYESRIDAESLHLAIKSLGGDMAHVVWLYHFAGMTMKRIGEVLDLSECRVSQLHTRAMNELRMHPRILACVGRNHERKEAVA